MKVEKEISKYLDRHLYPKMGEKFKRTDEREIQKKGIDVILHTAGEKWLIDDKCAIHHASENLPPFAFELLFEFKGKRKKGWLLKDLVTIHYNVMWFNTKSMKKTEDIKADDIKDIESMIISQKKTILDYLINIGYNRAKLLKLALKLKKSQTDSKRLTKHLKLRESLKLTELPVNLVIDKALLRELAVFHLKITENGIWDIRKKREFIPTSIGEGREESGKLELVFSDESEPDDPKF